MARWYAPQRGYYSAACKHGIMYGECRKCPTPTHGLPPKIPATAKGNKEDK